MKKTVTIIFLTLCIGNVFAQKLNVPENRSNEIKLNLAMTLALMPEINFERILSEDSGVGVGAMVSLSDANDFLYEVIPYYRFYFGNAIANGFFIELNTAIAGFRNRYYDYRSDSYSDPQPDFGVGFAIGYKYIQKKGIVGEIYAGLGRTINDGAYPRIGISIGKQF